MHSTGTPTAAERGAPAAPPRSPDIIFAALSCFLLLRLLMQLVLMLLRFLCEVAAAPHSLATARRQQLQQLVASRTETLVHIGVVLASAAARCDKLTAAREAFKEVWEHNALHPRP